MERRTVLTLAQHPKPRMRYVHTMVYNPDDGYESRWRWLCVGCGCYVYRDTAEEAYKAWCSRRAERWVEWQRQCLTKH